MSRTRYAVDLGASIFTAFNSGGLGGCTLAHSSMIVFDWAKDIPAQNKIT
ncbi:MAG: hypothetical protein HYY82_18115 [Deltaproteobacteria bacterium]|nr:hypothetical protein [Deltaproteobacteria bacterium]